MIIYLITYRNLHLQALPYTVNPTHLKKCFYFWNLGLNFASNLGIDVDFASFFHSTLNNHHILLILLTERCSQMPFFPYYHTLFTFSPSLFHVRVIVIVEIFFSALSLVMLLWSPAYNTFSKVSLKRKSENPLYYKISIMSKKIM